MPGWRDKLGEMMATPEGRARHEANLAEIRAEIAEDEAKARKARTARSVKKIETIYRKQDAYERL